MPYKSDWQRSGIPSLDQRNGRFKSEEYVKGGGFMMGMAPLQGVFPLNGLGLQLDRLTCSYRFQTSPQALLKMV